MNIYKRAALIIFLVYAGLLTFVWSQTPTSTVQNDEGEYIHVFFGTGFIKSAILGYIFLTAFIIIVLRVIRWFSTPRKPKATQSAPSKGPYLKPRKPL